MGQKFSILFSKLKEFVKGRRRRRCYLHGKLLSGRARLTIFLQRNPSFVEMLDQVHFSCRSVCWKVTKSDVDILWLTVSLRTFWTLIVDRRKFTTKWPIYGMSGFHFNRWNQLKVISLECTLRTRKFLKFSVTSDVG